MSPARIDSLEKLKNVYFLYGDEELLMEEALKRLRDLVSSEVDTDFNLEVLNAEEDGVEAIMDSAETVPLLSARRLVIVKEVDRLPRRAQEKLAEYLDSPNPKTILVLVAHFPASGEPRENAGLKKIEGSALFKKARQAGDVLKFTMGVRGRREKLGAWIGDQFKKRHRRIKPDARDLLIEKVGFDLRELGDAIERICLFSVDSEVIGEKEVEQVVVPSAELGVFVFVDAVADRRRDLSLYLLNRLIRQGESPYRLFSLLLRQFRLLARVKTLSADHDHQSIASELGIPPFLVTKCLQQGKRFSTGRLRLIFQEFKRAQIELHSSGYLGDRQYQSSILEMLIVKIIG